MLYFDFCLQVANEQHEVEIQHKNAQLEQNQVS